MAFIPNDARSTVTTKRGHNKPGPCQVAVFKFRNVRLDPARALEPARKKLTSIEAQRVMSVFDDTVQRVRIVTLLPYIIENLDDFFVPLGDELTELLRHHGVVMSSYEDIGEELEILLKRQAALRASIASSSKPRDENLEDEGIGEEEEGIGEEETKVAEDAEKEEEKEKDAETGAEAEEAPGEEAEEEEASVQSEEPIPEDSTEDHVRAAVRNLALVAYQLSHSVRNILRAFSQNPIILAFILEQLNQRNKESAELLQYLQDLRAILKHRLLTTPAEEQERVYYLTEIAKRERQTAVVIEKLEQELKLKDDDKKQEIFKKNETIKRIQMELHQIEKFSEENIRRVRADAEKQEVADLKNSEGKRNKLQVEVAQLNIQLQNLLTEHRERELDLRNKKFKIESEVENWIMTYDVELGNRQDEFEEIDAIYTEEKKQLSELEDRFKIMEAEYMAILADRQLAREKREKQERILAMKMKAATIIQAAWRSHKVRKALGQRRKKRAKAPEKKGKGKKKK